MGSDIGKVEFQESPADVLNGYQTFSATTAATTVINVPAGRTWVGFVIVAGSCANDAAFATPAQASAVITTAGSGVTPPAGTVMVVDALAGSNAVGGLSGTQDSSTLGFPLTVVAPGANAVQIQASTVIAGSRGFVRVACIGQLQ